MAWSKEDKDELLSVLRDLIGSSSRSTRQRPYEQKLFSGRKTSTDKLDGAIEDTTKEVENLGEVLSDLQKTARNFDARTGEVVSETKEYSDLIKRANAAIKKSTKTFDDIDHEARSLVGADITYQRDYIARYARSLKNLTNSFDRNRRASSMFGASLIAGHENIQRGTNSYNEMLDDLTNASRPLNKGLLKAAGAWDDNAKRVKEGLGPETFAALRLSIGEAQAAFDSTLKGAGFSSIDEVLSKGEKSLEEMFKSTNQTTTANKKLKDSVLKLAVDLAARGVDIGVDLVHKTGPAAGKINADVFEQLTNTNEGASKLVDIVKNLKTIADSSKDYISQTNKIAMMSNTTVGQWIYNLKSSIKEFGKLGGSVNALGQGLAAAGIAANLYKLKDAITHISDELSDFNIANVPKSFLSTQLASVKLGMSFKDTVKFMQENKRTMALYGDGFGVVTDKLQGTFKKFGFNMAQASDVIAPATEAATGAGVNIRSADALNNFIDQSMKSFQRVAGIVDITAQEYMRLNAALLSSEDIQNTLLGMDKSSAQARAQELFALRDNYVQLGLSTEQAQELVKAQQAQQREQVVSRVREGAKAMVLAGQAGLSGEDQMRIFQLARKGRKTVEEQAELQTLLGRVGTATEQKTNQAYGQSEAAGELAQTMFERLSPEGRLGEQVAIGKQLAVKERAGVGVTNAEAARQRQLAAGNEAVGKFSQVINQVSSLFGNSFSKALLAGTGSMIGLSFSAINASRALGTLSGNGGIFSKIAGKIFPKGMGSIFGGGGGEAAATAAEEAADTGVKATETVAKAGGEAAAKAGVKVGGETVAKEGVKLGGKTLGKSLLKKIPIIGLLAGLGFGAQRAMGGDWTGAGLEAASGVAGTLPGLGTAASIAIDAGLAGRDIYNATQAPSVTPPMVNVPGAAGAGAGVNNVGSQVSGTTEENATVLDVQDATAHDYLATIADNMVQAVKILQAMSEAGNTAAMAAVADRLRNQGIRPIPTANAFITGRQAS